MEFLVSDVPFVSGQRGSIIDAMRTRGADVTTGDAIEVLHQYTVDVSSVRVAARSFNTVFRVRDVRGHAYALRIPPATRIHPDGREGVETEWLAALRGDARIHVPSVVVTRAGASVADAPVGGGPARPAVLFDWMTGTPMSVRPSEAAAVAVGSMAARLHRHPSGMSHTARAGVPIADQVLYWSLPNRLPELSRFGGVVSEALARAEVAVAALSSRDGAGAAHLLHGDVAPHNVILRRDAEPALIDFDDLIWGVDIQDVAITVAALRGYPEGDRLVTAYRAGYEQDGTWPVGDSAELEALVAARRILQLNLGLNLRKPGIGAYIDRIVAELRAWMA